MRIVHVITRLIVGGAQENTLYNVEDLVRDFGDDVTLITGPSDGPEGDLLDRARASNLDVIVAPELVRAIRPATDVKAYRVLKRLLRELSPEVVHTHSSKAGILGRGAAWGVGVPAIIHTIHGLPFHPYERWWRNRFYVHAERWAARRCHRIVTVADAMIDQAVAAGVAQRDKFVTIYSGMDVDPFLHPPRGRRSVRAELGLAEDDLVVGKVARLFELKGHDDVIEAAAQVLARHPHARFVFIGGGTWHSRLQAVVNERGLAHAFRFTGLVPPKRIPELLGACDVVVHASYREGLARVLPQALISGVPAVSYDVDGAREVVLPGETGFLAPPGDVAELARSLDALLSNADLRREYGLRGREHCVDRFRHQTMTERIRQVYEQVLDQR